MGDILHEETKAVWAPYDTLKLEVSVPQQPPLAPPQSQFIPSHSFTVRVPRAGVMEWGN